MAQTRSVTSLQNLHNLDRHIDIRDQIQILQREPGSTDESRRESRRVCDDERGIDGSDAKTKTRVGVFASHPISDDNSFSRQKPTDFWIESSTVSPQTSYAKCPECELVWHTPRADAMPFLYTYTYTYTHTSPTAESCMYPVRRLSYTNPRSSNSTQIKGKLQCAMLKSHKNVTDYLAFETYLMRMRDIWGRGRPKSFLLPSKGGVKFTPGFAFTWRWKRWRILEWLT